MGGDTWKQQRRHWHCYTDEARVGETIEYHNRPEHAVAMTPEEVMGWMETETDRLLPRVMGPWRADADRLKTDDALRHIHLVALTWGKSTGATIRISDGLVVRLYALSVGPTDSPHALSVVPAICARTHQT